MDLALRLAEAGCTEATVVSTDHQTAGRGRQGRAWEAPPGSSLLVSVVLRPRLARNAWGVISPLVALAMIRSLRDFGIDGPEYKWPNDVLIQGHKISGILLQARSFRNHPDPVLIVGAGLNLLRTGSLPVSATSLDEHCCPLPARDATLDAFLSHLADLYDRAESGDTDAALRDLNRCLAFQDERTQLTDGDRTLTGHVSGVAGGGQLVFRDDRGHEHAVVAGELTRGPSKTDGYTLAT